MLTTLVASKPTKEQRRSGVGLSIAVHTVVITLAVYATAHAHTAKVTGPDEPLIYVHPPTPKPLPQPVAPSVPVPRPPDIFVPPVDVPPVISPVLPTVAHFDSAFFERRATGTLPPGGEPTSNRGADQVFLAPQVERTAALVAGTARPAYPDLLRTAGITGTVVAQFVVDTTGRVEAGSFKLIQSDNAAFTDAVKRALPEMRFRAAEAAGRRVRQLVEQQFTFALAG